MFELTGKGNTVAVISTGAVLDRNIGPEADSGRKESACCSASSAGWMVPPCLKTQDSDKIIEVVKAPNPARRRESEDISRRVSR